MKDPVRIEFRFPAHLGAVRLAVAAVAGACERGGLSEHEAGQLALALAEVLNNVVLHALADHTDEDVCVQAIVADDAVTLVVTDAGAPMPDLPAENVRGRSEHDDELPEGGFGRGLIRALLSDFRHERVGDRNVTTLVHRRRGRSRAA